MFDVSIMGMIVANASILRKTQAATRVARNVLYLACPYTDPDPAVRQSRFETATAVAADFIRQGRIVYSPITMTHPIDVVLAGATNTLGSDYWVAFDEAFMEMCSEMVVVQLDGWQKSNGIKREITYFKERGKPIRYIPAPSSQTIGQ
jgi:hypothetical protein